MLIEDIVKFIHFLYNKGQATYHNPEEIVDAVNRASIDLINDEITQYAQSKTITSGLRNFLTISPEISVSSGVGSLPNDYKEHNNEVLADDIPANIIKSGWWNNAISDPIEPPTVDYPICIIYGGSIEFRPTSVTKYKIHYFKYPQKAVYGYDYASDGRTPVFNESKSTDVDWPQDMHNKLIQKTLTYLGLNLKDANITQFEVLKENLDG